MASTDVFQKPDDAAIELAKTLVRDARSGALAVIDPASGAPSVSRVGVATDLQGMPLILVSTLAPHTKAIIADPRCSLLVGEPGKGDPLAHPRASVRCNAIQLAVGSDSYLQCKFRYLEQRPKAKLYADFSDFLLFRLEPVSVILTAGFGRAFQIDGRQILG